MKALLAKLIYTCLLIFPILFIAVPRSTTALATILALLAIIGLIFIKNFRVLFNTLEVKLVSLAFGIYTIVIILTQAKLGKFVAYEFQQQGRMLLLLPVFYYIYINKIELTQIAKYAVPIACIFGTLSSMYIFKGSVTDWGPRHTVQHIDPLNFSYLMLSLAFASLLIALRWTTKPWHKALCALAFFLGVYMSIKSGSRTGWLAAPLVIFWILAKFKYFKFYPVLAVNIFLLIFVSILYHTNEVFQIRTDDFFNNLIIYSWSDNPTANDTSIGIRISMLRMGWYCFTEAPWFGLGSENIYHILNIDSIKMYATDTTIKFASGGFMHNEFVTQVLKHGIFGGLAYLFILYCIIIIYIKSIALKVSSPMIDVFIIYIIFAVIASLSTEILVVKPMILFFGFMLACFAGETLWKIQDAEVANRSASEAHIGTRIA